MKMRSDPWLIVGLILAILLGAYNTFMEWRQEQPPKDEVGLMLPWVAVVFFTHWQRGARRLEPGGGGSKTEQAGYIPPAVQIERLLLAGERLRLARQEEFDVPADQIEDPGWMDMTRSPGFDIADASQAMLGVISRARSKFDLVKAGRAFKAALGGRPWKDVPDDELAKWVADPAFRPEDRERVQREVLRREELATAPAAGQPA